MTAFNFKRADKSHEAIYDVFVYPLFEETPLGSLPLGYEPNETNDVMKQFIPS